MKTPLAALLLFLLVAAKIFAAGDDDVQARQLATDVWQASGGENWANLKELRFTFVVEQDGQQLASVEHHWDMMAGTDQVKWKDKDATVNLASPAQEEPGKSAYARWVNDSYWLLAPLKILDPGVKLTYEGKKEAEGMECETLRLSFEQVGLTPGDQYVLYIDPQTKLVRAWDYIPEPASVMHATWENYHDFAGLKLATEHNFEGKTIRFTDVKATQR